MIQVRKAEDRGHTRTDWLDSRHTFSFGNYRDPDHTGFGPLLVLNDGHEFLVIDRGGPSDNCVEQYFTPKQGNARLFL